jgi:hypothetical protein
MRALLHYLAGRYKAVWVPSWQSDFVPIGTLIGSTINVQWAGYSRFGRQQRGRRDLRIELADLSVLYKRIVNSAELDADTEQLSIDPAFASSIEATQVRSISFMALSTLASDAVEINHITDSDGVADVSLQWEAVADEL